MAKDWNYKPGEWNLICDVCGKKMKSSSARHRWDGLIVCDEDFEHRHAQDFLKVPTDKTTVPFTRPIVSEAFRYTTPWDEDNPPFINGVSVVDSFTSITSYQRVFSETISVSDISRFNGLVLLGDSGDTVMVVDSFLLSNAAIPYFSDSAGTVSSGSIWHNNYIDGTYFASTYVANSVTAIA